MSSTTFEIQQIYKLENVQMRPVEKQIQWMDGSISFSMQQDYFEYMSKQGKLIKIFFANISSAVFVPFGCDNSSIFFHFDLKTPVQVGYETWDRVQFYMKLTTVQYLEQKPEFVESQFEQFYLQVEKLWEEKYRQLGLKFLKPTQYIEFDGLLDSKYSQFQIHILPSNNSYLLLLQPYPSLLINFEDIEVVSFEMILQPRFELIIIWKNSDEEKDFARIQGIPIQFLDCIEDCLKQNEEIRVFQRETSLNWRKAWKMLVEDPKMFKETGGWERTPTAQESSSGSPVAAEDEQEDGDENSDEEYVPPDDSALETDDDVSSVVSEEFSFGKLDRHTYCDNYNEERTVTEELQQQNSHNSLQECDQLKLLEDEEVQILTNVLIRGMEDGQQCVESCTSDSNNQDQEIVTKQMIAGDQIEQHRIELQNSNVEIQPRLEAHQNGFRYFSSKKESVDILYHSIQQAFLQPAENELVAILHFQLKNPISVGKERTCTVQFFMEIVDTNTEEIKKEVNQKFHDFSFNTQKIWEKYVPDLQLEFESPVKDNVFCGVVDKQNVFITPTKNTITQLTKTPISVVNFKDIEIVSLERVHLYTVKFDMVVIFKDFNRNPQKIIAIPPEFLDNVRNMLRDQNVQYYENRISLNWKLIMASINQNMEQFVKGGRWKFLNQQMISFLQEGNKEEEEEDTSDEDYIPSSESEDDRFTEYIDESSSAEGEEEDRQNIQGEIHTAQNFTNFEDQGHEEEILKDEEIQEEQEMNDDDYPSCERLCVVPICFKWLVCYCKSFLLTQKELRNKLKPRKGKL